MDHLLDAKKVKEKAVDLAFTARTVMQQLAAKDRSPEAFRAMEILDRALTEAIPDARQDASQDAKVAA